MMKREKKLKEQESGRTYNLVGQTPYHETRNACAGLMSAALAGR